MGTKILLEGWLKGIRLFHIAHSKAATHNARMHRALGVPVVIVTTTVGTTVFASMGKSPHIALVVFTSAFSLIASVLSGLQTFLNYSRQSERHKLAATKYGMLRRELEEMLCNARKDHVLPQTFLKNFRTRWDQVDQESPEISERIHAVSSKQLERCLEEERLRDISIALQLETQQQNTHGVH